MKVVCPDYEKVFEPMASFCNHCGCGMQREQGNIDTICNECGAPVSTSFSYCPWCVEKFEDGDSEPRQKAKGFSFDDKCPECSGGTIAAFKTCPWCGEDLTEWPWEDDDAYCENCEKYIKSEWHFCIYCGADTASLFINILRTNQGKILAGFRGYCGPTSMKYCLALLRIKASRSEVFKSMWKELV